MARIRTAAHLRSHLSVFEAERYPIQKGYIARLLIVDGRSVPDVAREVKAIVQANEPHKELLEGSLKTYLHVFKKLVLNKRYNLTAQWPSLIDLFLEPVRITFRSLSVAPASSQPGHTSPPPHPEPTSAPPSEMLIEPDTPQPSTSTQSSAPVILPSFSVSSRLPSPKKLKRDCANCVNKQRTITNMAGKVKRLKAMVRAFKLKKVPRPRKKQQPQLSVKILNGKIKRKADSAKLWKSKFVDMKEKHDDARIRLAQLDPLRQRVTELNTLLDTTIAENKKLLATLKGQDKRIMVCQTKIKLEKKMHSDFRKTASTERKRMEKAHQKSHGEAEADYQNQISILEEKVDDSSASQANNIMQTKSKGKYNVNLRLCVYDCVLRNVSVVNVRCLLRSIGKILFNSSFSDLPCASAVAQMTVEIGVIAEVQAGYLLDQCVNATLCWDSTTKRGVHINEVHVSVLMPGTDAPFSLTMSISSLSDGTTKQLYDNISQSLSDICETYSYAYNLIDADVRNRVFKKILATMSDRAAVNHCAHQEFENLLGNIVELKCSLHPLDGLAHAARRSLHQMDVRWKRSFTDETVSIECLAAQVIYQVSRLRFKDGSGDPAAFMVFLKKRKIKPSIILRYVGNRLNVMFHMAAVIHCHRSSLEVFMISRKSRKLCKQILAGLTDPTTRVQLQVLGLFSKYLTGPWMRFFYESDGGQGYAFAAEQFQPCIERLKALRNAPQDFNNITTDVFGNEIRDVQPELRHLEEATRTKFFETVTTLLDTFIETLTRQLGDGSGESCAANPATASAPMHNMHAERSLGMMDALMRRSPHSRLGFIDAKVKAKQNKTLSWLNSRTEDEKEKLVHFAMEHAPKVNRRMLVRKENVEQAVLNKYEQSVRNVFEKELKIAVDSVGFRPPLIDLDMFSKLDHSSRQKLKEFIGNYSALSGLLLRHVWHDGDVDCVYHEMVMEVTSHQWRGKEVREVEMWFWKDNELPSEDSFSMEMYQFLVDFAVGDLSFL